MNYMEQVAKMLGVELGEKFKIKMNIKDISEFLISENDVFYINENGIRDDRKHNRNPIFVSLLEGKASVVKIPWKPKEYEQVYFVNRNGIVGTMPFGKSIYDLAFYKLGKFYRTEAEAEAHAEEDAAYWESVMKELEE